MRMGRGRVRVRVFDKKDQLLSNKRGERVVYWLIRGDRVGLVGLTPVL